MKTHEPALDVDHASGTKSPIAVTRRRFLSGSTAVASALALPESARAVATVSAPPMASDFRRALNSEFRATALSQPSRRMATFTLTAVTATAYPHPSLTAARAKEMAFSLSFSTNETGFTQDTYLLSHPVLGEFAALMVPTAAGDALRAEFHRL